MHELPPDRKNLRLASTRTATLIAFIIVITLSACYHAANLASRLLQTSDSAQSFVAAHAILNGNVFLSGWHMPVDNFFATDTLLYVALERLLGPTPILLTFVPALVYSLLVFVGALACALSVQTFRERLQGILIVGFLLACPVWAGRWDPLLLSDFHVASTLAAFIVLSLCARIIAREHSEKRSNVEGIAVVLITAATVASDPFSLIFAFGSALCVMALGAILARSKASSALIALVAGIAVGLLLPLVVHRVAHGFGTESGLKFGVNSPTQIVLNGVAILCGLLHYFGCNFFGDRADSIVFVAIRLLGFSLPVVATVQTARQMVGICQAPVFDRFLFAGIFSLLAACILSEEFGKAVTPSSMWSGSDSIRYLVPAVFFSAILTGRRLPLLLNSMASPIARRTATGLLVMAAVSTVAAGDWPSQMIERWPRGMETRAGKQAAIWLERHNLKQGVGEYWSANLITALSGETVTVRSVSAGAGKLIPDISETDSRAYDKVPEFAIWEVPNAAGMTYKEVRATYSICELTAVGKYQIAVLSHSTRFSPCGDTDLKR